MAKPKKKSANKKKSSPKSGSKPKAKPRARARRAPPGLTDDQRASKLRPPANYDDALLKLASVMDQYKIRMPGVSSAKMRSNGKKAQAAWLREDNYRQQVEPRLRALSDARIVAEDVAWRTALDVYDLGKSLGRRNPAIAEALSFMGDYVGGGSSGATKSAAPSTTTS